MMNDLLRLFGLQRIQPPQIITKEVFVEKSYPVEVIKKVIKEVVEPLPQHGVVEAIEIDYVLGELVRNIPQDNLPKVKIDVYSFLRKMNDQTLKLLTELVSERFRKNAVYDCLYNRGYRWSQEEVPMNSIYLTKINEKTNAVLETLKRPYNLLDLVKAYKKKELPEGFELTSNPSKPIGFKPMLIFSEGQYKVIDGNHRITSLAITSTQKTLTAFVGRKG